MYVVGEEGRSRRVDMNCKSMVARSSSEFNGIFPSKNKQSDHFKTILIVDGGDYATARRIDNTTWVKHIVGVNANVTNR